MITNKPYFYDSFKCIADKCLDSCCIGWEIEIDETSLECFNKECGELGKKLKEKINDSSFILTENERCPFLLKSGLCELICEKGENYICEICREHPRYHEWYGNYHDVGLGLCCEAVCELLFQSKEPLRFINEDDGTGEENDELILSMLSQREMLMTKFTDRRVPLSQRLKSDITLEAILEIWDDLEPFDERWNDTTAYIKDNYRDLLSKGKDFLCHIGERVYEYEHLCIYLLHRYYMKGLCEYFTDSVLEGIAIYLGTQYLFDLSTFCQTGKFNLSDRIDCAKYISKQLEYSEENIDLIMNG